MPWATRSHALGWDSDPAALKVTGVASPTAGCVTPDRLPASAWAGSCPLTRWTAAPCTKNGSEATGLGLLKVN